MDEQNNNNNGNVASKGTNLGSSLSFLMKGKWLFIGGIALVIFLILFFAVVALIYLGMDEENGGFGNEEETEEVYDCSPINFKGTLNGNTVNLTATLDGGIKVKNVVGTYENNSFVAKNEPDKSKEAIEGKNNKEKIWIFLIRDGYSAAAAAGVMGNFQAESGFRPEAIESNGEGHGIAQWSFGRKKNLFAFANKKGKSWKDLDLQLEFFKLEMEDYLSGSLKGFKKSKDPVEAAIKFHQKFERSGDSESRIRNTRGGNAQKIYDELKNKGIYISIKAVGKVKDGKITLTGNVNGAKLTGDGTLKNGQIKIDGNYGADCVGGGKYIWPVAETTNISSYYGQRWGRLHDGIDIPYGSAVNILASSSGTVVNAGPFGGYGNYVKIKHPDGRYTFYGHMQKVKVKVNDTIQKGTPVGLMGYTGHCFPSGPGGRHLHFGMVDKNGKSVDPLKYVKQPKK